MDGVDLPVMDVEGRLGAALLPGIKALQVPLIVPHIPAPHPDTHSQTDSKQLLCKTWVAALRVAFTPETSIV